MSSTNSQSSRVSALLERIESRQTGANQSRVPEEDDVVSEEGYSEELFETEGEELSEGTANNRENMGSISNKAGHRNPSSGNSSGQRKASFSTINTASMAGEGGDEGEAPSGKGGDGKGGWEEEGKRTKLSHAEELAIRLEAVNAQNQKLRNSLESAHTQIEDLRDAQSKAKIRNERQVKVLNTTLAGLREERDRASAEREDTYAHLEAAKKLVQQLQCEVDDQKGVMKR